MPSFFSSGNIGVEKHLSSLLASHGFLREVVPKERPFSRILISSRIPSLLSASYLLCRDMDNSRLLIAHDSGGRALGCIQSQWIFNSSVERLLIVDFLLCREFGARH